MAVWYARQSANINAANVWNSAPDGSGSWLTWPPNPADVLVENNFLITVNVSITVAELRSETTGGAAAGQYFQVQSGGITITANIIGSSWSGQTVRTNHTSGTVFFVGAMTGGSAGFALYHFASGTVSITGTVMSGAARAIAGSTNPGILNITGDIFGNQGTAARIGGTRAVNVTGNVTASSVLGVPALDVLSASTNTITVSGYAQASILASAIGNAGQAIVTVGETRNGSNGRGAVTGPFRYASATLAKAQPIIAGSQQTLSVLDVAALVPAVTDVRSGVTYGDGAYTGTLPLQRKRASMAGRF